MTSIDIFIKKALEEQAEQINKNTPLALVENSNTALIGNILYPEILWTQALPTDNLNFAEGLPNVVVFPSSFNTISQWKKRRIGTVLNEYLPNPQSLILKWLEDTEEEQKKYNKILKEEITFLTQNF